MSLIIRDYLCPAHGYFELLEDRADVGDKPCPECGGPSEFCMSAPKVKTVWCQAVSTAKSDGPRSQYAMDTRPLAEGMPYSEWKAKRQKMWRDHDLKKLKEKIS